MENLENKIEEEALRMAKAHVKSHPPYYAQIPIELLRDPEIRSQAKSLYGLIHSYSATKAINHYPLVEITVRTMMNYMGVSSNATIWSWIRELRRAGLLDIIRQGREQPNRYILYPMKKSTFIAWKGMKRVHLRISYDHALAKRLRESLY